MSLLAPVVLGEGVDEREQKSLGEDVCPQTQSCSHLLQPVKSVTSQRRRRNDRTNTGKARKMMRCRKPQPPYADYAKESRQHSQLSHHHACTAYRSL
jgi:hypothetical protein